ncbi:hypothetical protein Avbf_18890, partial [Armadillidium vulgare]
MDPMNIGNLLDIKVWYENKRSRFCTRTIIDIKEEIEVKEETFYTDEENMESAQGFEGKKPWKRMVKVMVKILVKVQEV